MVRSLYRISDLKVGPLSRALSLSKKAKAKHYLRSVPFVKGMSCGNEPGKPSNWWIPSGNPQCIPTFPTYGTGKDRLWRPDEAEPTSQGPNLLSIRHGPHGRAHSESIGGNWPPVKEVS